MLSWRDLECPLHPCGSGLLVTVAWSWSEASAAEDTAGVAVGEVGPVGARAGAGGEPPAAETQAPGGECSEQSFWTAQPHPDSSKPGEELLGQRH